jgi:hypothetical protein
MRSTLLAAGMASILVGPVQAAGQVAGTFSVEGKTVKLTHGVAFTDTSDSRKPTLLVLADHALPEGWTSDLDIMQFRSKTPFSGVCFFSHKGEVYRTDYYVQGRQTGASGFFTLTLDAGDGKTVKGKASSTPAAAEMNRIKLDATFTVPLK